MNAKAIVCLWLAAGIHASAPRPLYGTVSVTSLRGSHLHRVHRPLPYVPVQQRDYFWRNLFPLTHAGE